MKTILCLIGLTILFAKTIDAQIITREDSLNAGLTPGNSATVISGYGEAQVSYDTRFKTAEGKLTRNVLFFGHKFNDKIGFFSEMELENAQTGSNSKGELSMEQLFLKINLNRNLYMVTGLFIPRIGIINENHLPTTFNGNNRHYVEQLIIPSTWRELGIGFYGQFRSIPGLNYSFNLMNGLNNAGFQNGTGIIGGKQGGSTARFSNISLSGSMLYYYRNFRLQTSLYYGGSSGLNQRESDSLQLNSGAFGSPVFLYEANCQYNNNGFGAKILGTIVTISDAFEINRAYATNTPSQMLGYLAEVSYNLLYSKHKNDGKSLAAFVRFENIDLNNKIPENGVSDNFQKKSYLITGISYQPIRGVSFKFDYTFVQTGEYNKLLYLANPYASSLPFYKTNNFLNLGMAYSF